MFGPNDSRVDAMYRQYLDDPVSVAEVWREFFADYEPHSPELARARMREQQAGTDSEHHRRPQAPHPGETPSTGTEPEKAEPEKAGPGDRSIAGDGETLTALTGPARIISQRMEDSLAIPVATSVRTLPTKLLEVNRETINSYLRRRQEGRKVSFTHLIGWAVVQAVAVTEGINVAYTEIDDKPHKVSRDDINLGLAISLGEDARASLVVPNIKRAQLLDFREFWLTYEDVVTRARNGDLELADFEGTTVTLTNPGTVGTTQSAPRLMEGQGAIIGVGVVAYPAELRGSDPIRAADAGLSRTVTLTSTYDHRVIQGARSGELLAKIEELLLGEDDFYDKVFAELGIHYTPARWAIDEHPARGAETAGRPAKEAGIARLITAYRTQGHLIADTDPLRQKPPRLYPELDIHYYGLTIWDLDREFATGGFGGATAMPLKRVLSRLRQTYCDTTGIEYMHITDTDQKRWIQGYVEIPSVVFGHEEKLRILAKLNQAEAFERFLHTKYLGQKRFGLEGSETLIPALDSVLDACASEGQTEVVMGMAHRGRLNVLTNIVGKSYATVFSEFEGQLDPASTGGTGDVKYHLGAEGKYETSSGEIAVELVANPSHLEAVDPVLQGVVRAKQERIGKKGSEQVMPVLIHGDAAFSGQGVVVETLHLSQLSGYQTGGTVHIVVNNQVGFTTPVQDARSSIYATDVAKAIEAPIIHVNGDDPEAVVRAGRLAVEYRNTFARDVVIDLVCYRRRGHNEGDEPSFTQPLMYKLIDDHTPVRKLYLAHLVDNGDISVDEGEAALAEFRDILDRAFAETRDSDTSGGKRLAAKSDTELDIEGVLGARDEAPTRVERGELETVLTRMTTPPEDFTVHPKLVKMLENRSRAIEDDAIDWGTAEAFALGTLARQGVGSRLAGEDSKRGTFSHRHAVLVCHDTGREWSPLAEIGAESSTTVEIVDSLLSEFAAVGFEYGYSIERADHLVIWEAQFGDFANGAQVVIDQFIAAGHSRWGQASGLVMLLPHGHDGQGPDHSSGRIERFLQLCAEDNMRVVVPATTGQYFHLLRRQAL
ncbi:MAG TPA: multifunctional oxoglutarate decarboxylase/oxoglutarate dehydrogenase thiamine pyrophosphate-binding subunit/dihydrolipoyllysine-residue succinyltransferase subunit, partial [Acidimicrobiia bacterium]|nr:multifunctional oxoglutarate decarboxylase/oxoglutarate dehydrogenase thiamine pyrophosphate-binding subunit/dihydrolipoyllysine-residue succinyltransferase subunit [Acidimicrobiia bacterium]